MKKIQILAAILPFAIMSCGPGAQKNDSNTPKNDQSAASTVQISSVKIGTQEWQNKNLDVVTFRNGDTIPEVKSTEDWVTAGKAGKPAWCYYNNDPAYGQKFGKLYNWFAVKDARGLAPAGWHVPTADEWKTMTDFLSSTNEAGHKLKSKDGWKDNGNGNDSSGFTGLPAACRYNDGVFYTKEQITDWWTSTEGDSTNTAAYRGVGSARRVALAMGSKSYGLYVRLVKDK